MAKPICFPNQFNRQYSSIFTFTCPVVDRSQLKSNWHQSIHSGYLQNVEHMTTRQTAYQRTSNHHPRNKLSCLSHGIHSNLWNGQEWAKWISPDTESIHSMRKGQETHTNGQRILLFIMRPLAISHKVWQRLYFSDIRVIIQDKYSKILYFIYQSQVSE